MSVSDVMKRKNPFVYEPGRTITARLNQRRMYGRMAVGPTALARTSNLVGTYNSVPRSRGAAVSGEMKYFDTYVDAKQFVVNDTWSTSTIDPTLAPFAGMNTLFAPTVGAGVNQRIGKGCKIMKIKIRGTISLATGTGGTAPPPGTVVRILLVQDKQTNAAQMAGSDLMTGTSGAGAMVAIQSFQNINNFGRFRVWKDKKFRFDSPNYGGALPSSVTVGGAAQNFKMSLRFGTSGLETRFNAGGAGTVADIVDNSFHIVGMASNNTLAPQITYYCRVCFKE